jgi:hypothetical protein
MVVEQQAKQVLQQVQLVGVGVEVLLKEQMLLHKLVLKVEVLL